jgi:hypothetical protein
VFDFDKKAGPPNASFLSSQGRFKDYCQTHSLSTNCAFASV